nr:fad-linked oxidoreductase [Quercus suber]
MPSARFFVESREPTNSPSRQKSKRVHTFCNRVVVQMEHIAMLKTRRYLPGNRNDTLGQSQLTTYMYLRNLNHDLPRALMSAMSKLEIHKLRGMQKLSRESHMASNDTNAVRTPTESDVNHLKKLLAGSKAKVLVPSDDGYAKSIERWSRAAEKPAAVAIVPSTTQEVALAVKFATDNNFDLAVKGGGHSTSGASSTNDGVLIDLGQMRGVRVDPEQKLLYIQGGCLWGDVDEAAWKYGLATVGGTVADTGVGGLTLGGGYGALSGSRGLVTDNMVGATVVLADGEVKTASRDENSELFWGLLGAGQNFGVTTEFVLKAYAQGDVYMGMMLFPPTPNNINKLVAAVNDLYEIQQTPQGLKSRSAGRTNTFLALAKPPPAGGQTLILVIASSFTTEAEGKELFEDFTSLVPMVNTMAMAPYPQVNKLVPAIVGMRSSMKGAAFKLPIRAKFVTDMLTLFEDFHGSCSDAEQSIVAWEVFDPSVVVANQDGCFANRGYHLNSLIMPSWTKPENDQRCRQWARDMSLRFKEELQMQGAETSKGVEGGVGVRGHKGAVLLYGNYDQYDEISRDIFGENYERLQKIKAQYDPKNKFNKLFAIVPVRV